MSRIEKGGNKFRPVARPQAPVRPKPAAPRPAPPPSSSSSTAATGAADGPSSSAMQPPASSQVPELTQNSSQAPATQASSSNLPPHSSFAVPPATPSTQATHDGQPFALGGAASEEDVAIPLRPPKPVNPYLDRVAPPPAFSPPRLKDLHAALPRGGGRVAPRLATSGGATNDEADEQADSIIVGSSRRPSVAPAVREEESAGQPISAPSRHARAPTLAAAPPSSSPVRPPPATQPSSQAPPIASSPAPASSTSAVAPPPSSQAPAAPVASGSARPKPAPKKRAPKRTRLPKSPEPAAPEASTSTLAAGAAPAAAATEGVQAEGEDAVSTPAPAQGPLVPTRRRRPPPQLQRASAPIRPIRSTRNSKRFAEPSDNEEDELAEEQPVVPVGESDSDHGAGSGDDDNFPAVEAAIYNAIDKGKGKAPAMAAETAAAKGKAPAKPRKPRQKRVATAGEGEAGAAGVATSGAAPAKKPPAKRRKKAAAATDADGAVIDGEAVEAKPKPKRKLGRPRKVIKTPPLGSVDDGEVEQIDDRPFDLSTATMSELCADPGVGRISTRFEEIQKKAADLKESRKLARLRMKARVKIDREGGKAFDDPSDGEDGDGTGKGGNGADDEEQAPSKGSAAALDGLDTFRRNKSLQPAPDAAGPGSPSAGVVAEVNEDQSDDDDYGAAPSGRGGNSFAPQMRVVNGQLILDQDSLQIDQHAQAEEQAGVYEEVEERDLDRFVNQDTWRKNPRGERWGKDETELFYDALQQFGSDFEMIARLFPGRTRKMVKNKFTREERYNEARVTRALTAKIPIDMKAYERATRKDFSGPAPVIKIPSPPPQLRAASEGAQSASTSVSAVAGGAKKRKRRGSGRDGEEILGLVEEREPTPEPVVEEVDAMAEFGF